MTCGYSNNVWGQRQPAQRPLRQTAGSGTISGFDFSRAPRLWGARETAVAGTKTFQAKPGQIAEKWLLVDATDKVVGRLASDIAMILMGKHRPTYTPHVLCCDALPVIIAEKVHFSGKK